MHIGAFEGKDEKNNKSILKALAFNGSLVKYDVFKLVKEQAKIAWSTISRRIDDLKERGYLIETGTRMITVGRRMDDSPIYGLTWKGFIAILIDDEVRNNIIAVVEKNPQLEPLNKILQTVKGFI